MIFESLNSTGRELSQADLIRNFILMGLEPSLQARLYEHHWRPMEVDFGQDAYDAQFDGFMRHYLTVKTGEIPNINKVYDAFKDFARSPKAGDTEQLVSDIRLLAGYYCAMALGQEEERELKDAFQDLKELRVDVAFPLLLELYSDYRAGLLTKKELLQAVRLIESYVFRRAVCGIPTNSLNKTFATFTRAVRKDSYVESIQAAFLLLPSYRRFPSDAEFSRDLQSRDLYHFRSHGYFLRRLENHGRKEPVDVAQYSVEHIMPQNEALTGAWRDELGTDWERIHRNYLHTLGNLTLTGYNPDYSDRPFEKKRDMKGGFRESPLRLNQGLAAVERWDEDAIRNRAARLTADALDVWAPPVLAPEVLEVHRARANGGGHSIEDYPHLASGPLRPVFEEFRKQVLGLDPCVSEEFLKYYVAYKAETNFVDVESQVKRLRLTLNMAFHEVNDPRGICKNVSGLGRWGNGDVEVGLVSIEELPYVMGLVRQSFARQMGNGAET